MSATQLPNFNTDTENSDRTSDSWQQGDLISVAIADLNDTGDGVGRVNGRVVFVPDTVPGDRVLVRLVRVKSNYAHGKLYQLLEYKLCVKKTMK